MSGPISSIANGNIAEGSTPSYMATIVDGNGNAIPASSLTTLTLTIANTTTGVVINNCQQVNILNSGRGTVDANGLLTINLLVGDTSLSDSPGVAFVSRSLIIDWTYNGGTSTGRAQRDFIVRALAGL